MNMKNDYEEALTKSALNSLDHQAKKEKKLCMESAACIVLTVGAVGVLGMFNTPAIILGTACALGTGVSFRRAFLADKASQNYQNLTYIYSKQLDKYAMKGAFARESFIQQYPNLSGRLTPVTDIPKTR